MLSLYPPPMSMSVRLHAAGQFFADGKTDTGTREFGFGVKPLEYLENFRLVIRLDADTVIADFNAAAVPLYRRRQANARCFAAIELETIADQIQQHLKQL